MLIANRIVNPIVVGKREPNGTYDISGNVLGTCFSIGSEFCLTAGHVISDIQAQPAGTLALFGIIQNDVWNGIEFLDSEILDADVGIIKYSSEVPSHSNLPAMSWDLSNPPVLSKVRSVGYPYGLHTIDGKPSILARAFEGYVVCTIPRFRPDGQEGPAFSIHELSFLAPRGLSGAPLLSKDDSHLVRGIVIGNKKTDMWISTEIEKESNGSSVHTVEHREFLYFGIAVRAEHLSSLNSLLLGCTIGEHLRKMKLLSDPVA